MLGVHVAALPFGLAARLANVAPDLPHGDLTSRRHYRVDLRLAMCGWDARIQPFDVRRTVGQLERLSRQENTRPEHRQHKRDVQQLTTAPRAHGMCALERLAARLVALFVRLGLDCLVVAVAQVAERAGFRSLV